MIRILMKKQLKMLFSGFFVDRKTGKSRSKGAAGLYGSHVRNGGIFGV